MSTAQDELQKYTTSYTDVNGCGLLFVRSLDPISRLMLSISDEPFSDIGFYYTSTATGVEKIHISLLSLYDSRKPLWLNTNTMKGLAFNNLVDVIAIRQLKPVVGEDSTVNIKLTNSLENIFKSSIVNVISTGCDINDIPKQLFTRLLHNTESITSVMVSEIVEIVELELKNLILGIDSSQDCETVIDCKSEIYYEDITSTSTMFDKLTYILMPERDRHVIDNSVIEFSNLHKHYINSNINKFVTLLIDDLEFLEELTSHIAKRKSHDVTSTDNACEHACEKLFNIINTGLDTGHIDYERILELSNIYNSSITIPTNKIIMNELHIPYTVTFHDKDNLGVIENNTMSSLRDELTLISETINGGETPVININSIIANVNRLIASSNSDCELIPSPVNLLSYAIVNPDENTELKLTLESGRQTIITCQTTDLSCYSKDELMELLVSLDIRVANDSKYDSLRSLICNTIASMSL